MVGRLTYANVTATLALLIALAAGIYTLSSENDAAPAKRTAPSERGVDAGPAPNSLGGDEIDESALATVPRANRARTARRAGDARRLGGKGPSQFVPAAKLPAAGALVKLRTGGEKRLVKKGPLELAMDCVREPRGLLGLQITMKSSTRGAYVAALGKLVPLNRDDRRIFLQIKSKKTWIGSVPWSAAEPGGTALSGIISFGVGVLGSDCAVSVTAVG